ncbi:hypothetical protein [Spectribacter hydrogenoxidans]|uniref:Uncharacterized protein n=1 Tax=Spectribacter hydrogenoxidans TaxID=3075608 RepID=A0ABU3BY19_9GAMM|nr:hypothetical protein [Salinisphaera sp. W335]MDT0634199.1 hypothetical protein [Salinisphaera sp. W335]
MIARGGPDRRQRGLTPALLLTPLLLTSWATSSPADRLETQRAEPVAAAVQPSWWQVPDWSAELGLEARHFPDEPADDRQFDGVNLSASMAPSMVLDWDNRDQRISVELFGRVDQHDSARTHADVREALYRYTARSHEWRIGWGRVFWGATEWANIVDIVNQRDFVEDPGGAARLGQPMVNLSLFLGAGTLDIYLLPGFRERTFPDTDGRPRPLLPVDDDASRFESHAGDNHVDLALRYRHNLRGWDVGVSYFRGTARDPRFDIGFDACTAEVELLPVTGGLLPPVAVDCAQDDIPTPPADELLFGEVAITVDNPVFVPVYDQIDRIGLDVQGQRGRTLWKLEAIHEWSRAGDFHALVGGLEYSFYDLGGSGMDLGVIAEYLYDSRGRIDPALARAAAALGRRDRLTFANIDRAQAFRDSLGTQRAAPFNNDVFVGTRLSVNDLPSTTFLAGAIVDTETGAVLGSLEASRRLGSRMRLSAIARVFANLPVTDPAFGFRRDDYLQVRLTRFF